MYAPLLSGNVYHIYNHANGEDNLFVEKDNYRYFMERYAHHIAPVAETYAWCLMPNHLHLMVRIREEDDLKRNPNLTGLGDLSGLDGLENLNNLISKKFSNLFNAYTKAFNKKYNRRGSLFQRPFKRKEVSDESYFSQLVLYIHQNPLHHGFVKKIDKWPHSSWFQYLAKEKSIIEKDFVINWFGGEKEFIDAHQLYVPGKLVSSFD